MNFTNPHIALKASKLAIGYKTSTSCTTVANAINLNLNKGEFIGLIGTNGIGKSTLLKTLTQQIKPLKGSIHINSKLLSEYNPQDFSKKVSLVLTEKIVAKNLSVFEIIALGRQPYTNWLGQLTKVDYNIIQNCIALLELTSLKNKKCYELSDGQFQKVMIARALVQETDIIILDEPTSHLDLHYKAHILKLLKTLAKNTNKTIIFSSHEIDLSIQLCDKLIVMLPSKTICQTPEQLHQNDVFSKIFPKNLIVYNKLERRFKIPV